MVVILDALDVLDMGHGANALRRLAVAGFALLAGILADGDREAVEKVPFLVQNAEREGPFADYDTVSFIGILGRCQPLGQTPWAGKVCEQATP